MLADRAVELTPPVMSSIAAWGSWPDAMARSICCLTYLSHAVAEGLSFMLPTLASFVTAQFHLPTNGEAAWATLTCRS